jgi:AsmA protein
VRVFGTFKEPEFELEKGPLLARAGSAIALAATAPLAALLPLLETGPGVETNCAAVQRQVAPAAKQAKTPRKRK